MYHFHTSIKGWPNGHRKGLLMTCDAELQQRGSCLSDMPGFITVTTRTRHEVWVSTCLAVVAAMKV
jgi:hypothetical protein